MTIGVAIIGSGIFAKDEHLPAVQACKDLNLLAAYSRSLKSAQGLAEGLSNVDLYSDDAGEGKSYHDLLLRKDIDAVIIALPIPTQAPYIQQALEAGKHVLSEKPIGADIAQARDLMKVYGHKKSAASWSIAENYRFVPSFLYAAEKVLSIGKVISFRAKICSPSPAGGRYFETPWRKTPTHQGGFLLDGGVHYVALVRLLLGPANAPARLSAFTSQLSPDLPPADTLDSVWQTASGVSGTFSASFAASERWSDYFVMGEQGSVTISGWPRKVTTRVGGKVVEEREFKDEGSGVKDEVAAWAQAIKEGGTHERLAPREALLDLEVLEGMLQSGEKGGAPVDLVLAGLNE